MGAMVGIADATVKRHRLLESSDIAIAALIRSSLHDRFAEDKRNDGQCHRTVARCSRPVTRNGQTWRPLYSLHLWSGLLRDRRQPDLRGSLDHAAIPVWGLLPTPGPLNVQAHTGSVTVCATRMDQLRMVRSWP